MGAVREMRAVVTLGIALSNSTITTKPLQIAIGSLILTQSFPIHVVFKFRSNFYISTYKQFFILDDI